MINYIYILFSLFFSTVLFAQEVQINYETLTYEEFIGYVKKHHPIIKQANLVLNSGEAYLLKSRGGFDPKLEIDYNTKEFKDTEYYDLLNATFKIPTWYGIELKANFEENSGEFLNPQNSVPTDGLYSAGISVSALEGLLINDRMASLKKARYFVEQSKAERDLIVNDLLLEATQAYFDWVKASNEQIIYTSFLENANIRFNAIKRNVEIGANAAIDSIEAQIVVQNRNLDIEVSKLNQTEKRLKVSNYLWLNNIPIELKSDITPVLPQKLLLTSTNEIEKLIDERFNINEHPKVKALGYKVKGLEVDRRLKTNKLLPKLDVQYNFITSKPEELNSLNNDDYKASVSFTTPLFLRKERGDLKLAKYKLQDANLEQINTQLKIQNKVINAYAEINSLDKQFELILAMVSNYQKMVIASERKLFLGESSLLAVNLYERKLIDAELKQNSTQIKLLNSRAKLFSSTALMPFFSSLYQF